MHFNTAYPNHQAAYASASPIPYDRLDKRLHPDTAISLPYSVLSPELSDSYVPSLGFEGLDSVQALHLDALTHRFSTQGQTDPLGEFFTGKRQFLAKSVEDILGSIYERETLRDGNLRHIDYESAQQKSRLFQIDDWRAGLNPNLDKTRSNIERELIGFEREKRFEQVACWRDIVRLKGDLREALHEFQKEKSKDALLGSYKV